MTCQRPGCENEVGVRTDTGSPKRYCDDPDCRRLRNNAASLLHYNRAAGKVPRFKAKGIRKDTKGAPAPCDQAGSDRGPQGAKGASVGAESPIAPLLSRAKGPESHPQAVPARRALSEGRATGKDAPRPDGKVSEVDRQAKLAGIDRGTREGFKRYMEERPVYFQWVFPRMTIAEAWGMVAGRT